MVIQFEATLLKIQDRNIIRVPSDASEKLPSRGIVMVKGTLGGTAFKVLLEPDGKGSHWFEVSDQLIATLGLKLSQTFTLSIETTLDWIEPEIPEDINRAIIGANLNAMWQTLTPQARWEWFRWIRGTNNPSTRQKRIEVACSKLKKGDKRPCCFNTSLCSVPELSKSGVLKD